MAKIECYHWADQVAQRVIKEKGDKKSYTVAAGITPSGTIHIGNFREIITVELVKRALEKQKKKVRFIYSWDDYDVFRKVPKNMPNQEALKQLLRKPIVDVPDTFDCKHESYARHNQIEVEEQLPRVGVKPEFIYQHKMYRACKYAEEMHHALSNKDKIIEILNKFRKEPLGEEWYPVSVFCESCGTDETTVEGYDKNYQISYSCKCGNANSLDIREKGNAKLKWRVDWPMRWHYEKVDFEPGGKDHSTTGGSRDTGAQIIKEVWEEEPPVYSVYDFIRIKGGGGKMSSSKGDLVTLKDVLDIYEPEMVRWFFAGTRPGAEFAISFDTDVLQYYEDFDKCERIYFGEQKAKNEKEEANQKRIYELSCINKVPKSLPFQPSFRHLCNVLQINNLDIDKSINFYEKQLKNKEDKEKLRIRAECAVNWIKNYAPEDFKFSLQDKVPNVELNNNQKKSLRDIAEILKKKDNWTDEELHEEFYIILKNNNLETKDFFKAAYNVLINKDKGPKLAAFVLEVKDHAIKLFEKV